MGEQAARVKARVRVSSKGRSEVRWEEQNERKYSTDGRVLVTFGRFYTAVDFLPRYKGTFVILIFCDYETFV